MTMKNRIALLRACEEYLETKPDHRLGFCFWAAGHIHGRSAGCTLGLMDEVHHLVEGARKDMAFKPGQPYKPMPCYVSEYNGYNEERAQFVADLRAWLLADL